MFNCNPHHIKCNHPSYQIVTTNHISKLTEAKYLISYGALYFRDSDIPDIPLLSKQTSAFMGLKVMHLRCYSWHSSAQLEGKPRTAMSATLCDTLCPLTWVTWPSS